MAELAGTRVWLTGASMGIGRAVALELARRGAVTAITARSEDTLREVAREMEAIGGRAIVAPGDVTDPERMREIAADLRAELGAVDVLVANAGTHLFTKPEDFDASEYMFLMDLNYGGMVRCIEAVLPDMLERGAGHVVGMASLAGMRGLPRAAAYGASKAAMIHFLESLRFHVAPRGVAVTIVNPGFVRTPLTDKNDFKMPFLMEPDDAARVICDGIARRRSELSFPRPFNWAVKLVRLLPGWLYRLVIGRIWSP